MIRVNKTITIYIKMFLSEIDIDIDIYRKARRLPMSLFFSEIDRDAYLEMSQTEEVCRLPLKKLSDLDRPYYVKSQNERSLSALHKRFLRFIYSREFAIGSVQQNRLTLRFVVEQVNKICLTAVGQNGLALEHVDKQNNKICRKAVRQNGLALQYVTNQTEAICRSAVRQNGLALQYVTKQTEELCKTAIEQNPNAYIYVKIQIP